MFKTRNNYRGAQFDYESDVCKAAGKFNFEEDKLEKVDIQGAVVKDGETYAFRADRDNQGTVNIYGVTDVTALATVGGEVANIIAEIEDLNSNEE